MALDAIAPTVVTVAKIEHGRPMASKAKFRA
jgi:hypothetical protein